MLFLYIARKNTKLKFAVLLKTIERIFMEDDVVHKVDIEEIGGLFDLASEQNVSFAGLEGAGRMVVANDDVGCFAAEGFLENKSYVNSCGGQSAFADLFDLENSGCLVQIDDPEFLVSQMCDFLLHNLQNVLRRMDMPLVFDFFGADSSSQFECGLQSHCFGWPNAVRLDKAFNREVCQFVQLVAAGME